MSGIFSLLSSLTIILVFWIFSAAMVNQTLARKYSLPKTITSWAVGFCILVIACIALLITHEIIAPNLSAASFDLIGYITDTIITLLISLFFLLSSVKIYRGTLSEKIFSASLYAIINLSCSDIALILMKYVLSEGEYNSPVYYLGQSFFLILLLTAVLIIVVPPLSVSLKELFTGVKYNLKIYLFVPVITYLSYLTICCLWNTQPGSFMMIPQIITRVVTILLIIVVYVVVILSIRKTTMLIHIDEEMKIAKYLQTTVLPKKSLLSAIPNTKLSAYISPFSEIGGDFYDVFKVDEEKYGVFIADVAGKGIPASLLMMRAKTILSISAVRLKMPGATLSTVNKEIAANNESCMFVSAFFGVVYPYGKFVYSSAGHPAPLLCRNGSVEELKILKAPVIGITEYSYHNSEMELEDGDIIFMYTDGLTEVLGKTNSGKEEEYGKKRLFAVLANQTNPDDMISAVNNDLNLFTGGAEQSDDITMLALQYQETYFS